MRKCCTTSCQPGCIDSAFWPSCGAAESAVLDPQLLLCRYAVPCSHGKQAQQILEQHTPHRKSLQRESSERLETPMVAPSTLLSNGDALHHCICPLCLCALPAGVLSAGVRLTPAALFLVA